MSFVRVLKPPGGDSHDLFNGDHSPCVPGHHRVLKPPGGGSSDIFGTPDSVKSKRPANPMQSNIFPNGDVPQQNGHISKERPGDDSMKKIFGSLEPTPSRKVKDHMKSKIFTASDEENEPANANQSPRVVMRNPVTGEGCEMAMTPRRLKLSTDNNHILSNSEEVTKEANVPRNRVPPGGHSTKLW